MLAFDVDSRDPRPVFRQIADEIQRCIVVGVLKPGEPLPAARQLAQRLKVNTNTVQHAYRTLEAEGLVHVRRGLGTFISSRPKESSTRQSTIARQIAERMLREGYRHGLLASDLIAALREIAPRVGKDL
ncbi:MAG TPA: GntR family transcriptional regulator [Vicinamibacterales bacterium]|jgi:GntR family transcriptional regulator|nr:GntR family transcriptional regulator [Vicinamibacterales bacterium]